MAEELYTAPPFDRLWAGKDAFAEVSAITGEVFRSREGRRTVRFQLPDGGRFFLKEHRGIGWGEVFKNLLQGKIPVTGAGNEYRAIRLLAAAGVPTMEVAAYGRRGSNPAHEESFLITRELAGMPSCEDYCRAGNTPELRERRALIRLLADDIRRMHACGVNHRDCYLCHFLIDRSGEELRLRVIDLHRAQIRSGVPFRWQVKDLAGIYFSAQDYFPALTRNDRLAFISAYSGGLRKYDRKLWRRTEDAARRLLRRGARG